MYTVIKGLANVYKTANLAIGTIIVYQDLAFESLYDKGLLFYNKKFHPISPGDEDYYFKENRAIVTQ